jgi:alkylation response protein AidB-like acyl-CoA dehydrogenase
MTLDQETAQKLRRLTELYALMVHLGDEAEEETCEEYRQLQEPLVQEFLPLVRKLVQAGLLTLDVPEEAFAQTKGFVAAAFDAVDAFNNGNIWLSAGALAMGKPKTPSNSNN